MPRFFKQIQNKTSSWTLIAFITFVVQVYRHSYSDGLIFGIAFLVLHFESSGRLEKWQLNGFELDRTYLRIFVGISMLCVYLTDRHEPQLALYFVITGLFLFAFLWDGNPRNIKLNRLETKSAIFWSICGLLLAVWEVLALVLAIWSKNEDKFPTLSELAAPILVSSLERLQFAGIWLLVGYYLIAKWKKI